MAIEVVERWNRKLDTGANPTAELGYFVFGTDDELAARAAVKAQLQLQYAGLTVESFSCEHIGFANGLRVYQSTVRYAATTTSALRPGEKFTFDFATTSAHLDKSLQTIGYLSLTSAVPNAASHRGSINVTPEGIGGVDILIPEFRFTLTVFRALSLFTEAYQVKLARLTTKTNLAPFRGFASGEVQYLGASGGGEAGNDAVEITHRFAVAPNVILTGINDTTLAKEGWNYAWYTFLDSHQADGQPVKEPKAVYVERVYDQGNFADLELSP